MENILEIKDLNIGFKLEDEFARAIHGVSLSIEKGKSLGVVGESGCGKSVTATSIMRLLPSNAVVESGEIVYDGQNLLKYSEKEMQKVRGNKIVLIPQDPLTSLNPLYTIGDQISEVIELHHKVSGKEAKNRAIEALRQVNIPEPENRFNDYPHQFSGGMRQRVIIAMALSCNPELIIADEPTTALDVTVQAQILALIKSIQDKHNTTLLLITHDLGVVAEACDYVAVMYAGRIIEYANVKNIFNNPMHPYTKGLLESLPLLESSKLKPINGQPPNINEKINGCVFHPRCPSKIDICENEEPEANLVGDSHKVCCHLHKTAIK
ncbi:MAG: peptide ABC transporter ATP-binding protein [Candidatus Melainabacteria bacterium GWF2_32_7]|nr:MAG: peptide ABC transporter ATP-binding protein [Candidatus Melainabacteria bacterium GWF2_32_7]